MSKSLTDRTLSGLNWNFLRNYGKTIITMFVGVLLARLLPPEDFGLLGMTVIFTGLADLFVTLGMGSSVIRIKNLTDDHIRTATTTTMVSGIVIYIIFWFTAPAIGQFYNEPRIPPIIRVLSLLFLIKGLTTVSFGQITKEIDFKSILIIELTSYSLGYALVSSVLAILGFGVWSLVYGKLSTSILSFFLITRRMPIKIKPLIKKQEFKELAGFGTGISLSKILLYASSNIDFLIIGKFFNTHLLGLYTRAFNLMTETISKVISGTYNVLFPAFALVQNEPEKLRRAYFRTIKTVAFFIFPILGSMIVAAEYIIKGLYGNKWGGAITSFQILAVGGILRSTLSYSGAIAHAAGKVFTEAKQQIMYLVLLTIGAYSGIRFGIEGVAAAVIFALFCLFIAQSNLSIKIIQSTWKEFFITMIPGITNLISMVVVNFLIRLLLENTLITSYEIKLTITVLLNIPAFLIVIVITPYSLKNDTLDWLIEKYKRYFPSRLLKVYFAINTPK